MTGRPNVLFLVVDSLRYDAVADGDLAATPAIAELAAEGTTFETCYSQGISTAPAMTAMLTGRLPLDYGGHWYVHDDQPTMAEEFRADGYTTAAIHSNPNVSRLRNFDAGFDTFDENILPLPSEGLLELLPDGALRYLNKGIRLLSRTPYLPADAVNDQMATWLDGVDGPWFLWSQYMDTHGPYLPGDEFTYRNKVRAERLWRKGAVDDPTAITDEQHRELRRNYRLEVEYFDAALGRFLDRLRRDGRLENTIVILTADHGDEFGEHGLYGHKNLPYEELVRVPLIVRFPDDLDVPRPDKVGTPVRSIDVLPTVFDVLDVELSSEMEARLAGESLFGVLDGGATGYDAIVTEKEMRGEDALRFGFRADEWTYLYDGLDDRELLFDRDADPHERVDVSADNPEVLSRFRETLADRLSSIEATSDGVETPAVEEAPGVRDRLEALGYVE